METIKLRNCFTKLVLLALCLSCFQVKAEQVDVTAVHYTTLLPLITNLEEKSENKIFSILSKYLKKDKRTEYKNHDGFYEIFRKYKEVQSALNEIEIIKLVGRKLLAGSIIRVKIKKTLTGHDLIFDVFSKAGENLFHREKLSSKQSERSLIELLEFWINYYIDLIPYDASIVELKQDKLLVEFPGDNNELFPNQQFIVLRQRDTDDKSIAFREIGYGMVGEITRDYFVGNILERKGTSPITKKDKIIFKIFDQEIADKNPDYKYRTHDLGNYRKYGRAALFANAVQIRGEKSTANFVGIGAALDLFLPSNIIFNFEFRKRVGQSDNQGDNPSVASGNSLDNNSYKAVFGKTFQPRSYKYISYIDVYAGWSVEQLLISGIDVIGVGDISFSGPLVGLRLEHPIYTNLSAITSFEYSISPRFEEKDDLLGEASSTSGYALSIGARYLIKNSGYSIEATLRRHRNTAELSDNDLILKATTTQLFLGGSYFF